MMQEDPASTPAITPSLECRMWIEERYLQLRTRELGRGDDEAPASLESLWGVCWEEGVLPLREFLDARDSLGQMGHKGTGEKERGRRSSGVTGSQSSAEKPIRVIIFKVALLKDLDVMLIDFEGWPQSDREASEHISALHQ